MQIDIPRRNEPEEDIIEQTFGSPNNDEDAKKIFADLPTPKSKMQREIDIEKSAIQVSSAAGQ